MLAGLSVICGDIAISFGVWGNKINSTSSPTGSPLPSPPSTPSPDPGNNDTPPPPDTGGSTGPETRDLTIFYGVDDNSNVEYYNSNNNVNPNPTSILDTTGISTSYKTWYTFTIPNFAKNNYLYINVTNQYGFGGFVGAFYWINTLYLSKLGSVFRNSKDIGITTNDVVAIPTNAFDFDLLNSNTLVPANTIYGPIPSQTNLSSLVNNGMRMIWPNKNYITTSSQINNIIYFSPSFTNTTTQIDNTLLIYYVFTGFMIEFKTGNGDLLFSTTGSNNMTWKIFKKDEFLPDDILIKINNFDSQITQIFTINNLISREKFQKYITDDGLRYLL